MAERLRQSAIRGDFSTLIPTIQIIDNATLKGAHGAYAQASSPSFCLSLLRPNQISHPGNHRRNRPPSGKPPTYLRPQGRRRRIFRRRLLGESVSASERENIRRDHDHGTITVNGESVEVEFFLNDILKTVFKPVETIMGGIANNIIKPIGETAAKVIEPVGKGNHRRDWRRGWRHGGCP